MKSLFVLIFTAMCVFSLHAQVIHDSVWSNEIKTVTLYRSGIDQEVPVMLLGSNDRLQLRFDLLAEEPTTFRYTLRHCDAEWRLDDLESYEYLSGIDDALIDDYTPSLTTLQPYYNYKAAIPAAGMTLLLSGNYALIVRLQDDPDSIVLTCRFRISEELLNPSLEIVRPTSGMRIQEDQEVNVALEQKPDLVFGSYLPFSFTPTYLKLYLQQNGRLDNQRVLPFSSYSGSKLCYRWKPENVFAGGNSFRYFDFSNLRGSMYNVLRMERFGGEFFAILRPEEDRSRQHYTAQPGLNGGFKINAWDRSNPQVESEYAWVNISLPMSRPYLNGSVHVVGGLTQWRMDEYSRMEWQPQYKAYTLRLLLKQGYYSYQILFCPTGETVGLTATLEGDHIETPNDYHLYVYYRAPGDRYDRLLSSRTLSLGSE
ncbi:MAG: DUF5103 domain-containing protein [Bacteroidales bacterium]|nr:DUF5103 domain-containing protein [Bacteroidales bacterium]